MLKFRPALFATSDEQKERKIHKEEDEYDEDDISTDEDVGESTDSLAIDIMRLKE